MKLSTSPIRLILCLFIGLALFSCEEDMDAPHLAPSPQLSDGGCDHLAPDDLDLSAGFKGTYQKLSRTADADFRIVGHRPSYPFLPGTQATGDCEGLCSIRIVFEPATEGGIPSGVDVNVSSMSMEYSYAGTTTAIPDVSFEWNYPELFVYDIYANAILDYEVTFEGNSADFVEISQVDVVGGLCVIENIDEIDPIFVTSIDPDNNSGN